MLHALITWINQQTDKLTTEYVCASVFVQEEKVQYVCQSITAAQSVKPVLKTIALQNQVSK